MLTMATRCMLVNQETDHCQKDLSLVSLERPNTEKRSVSKTKRVKLKEDPITERKEDCQGNAEGKK